MATTTGSTPHAQPESKSAKKKKAKAETSAKALSVPSDGDGGAAPPAADTTTNGADGAYESPYLKELNKYVLPSPESDHQLDHWLIIFMLLETFVI